MTKKTKLTPITLTIQTPPKSELVKKPEDTINAAEWLDTLTWRKINIGGRLGHTKDCRFWAIKQYGAEQVAAMTDADLTMSILEDGLIPVIVNGTSDDEGVFLISKEALRRAPFFSR